MTSTWTLVFALLAGCGDDASAVDSGPADAGVLDGATACPTGTREHAFVDPVIEGESAPFPAGFLWGSATAPHQVEGGNVNSDWWQWEQMGRAMGESSDDGPDHYTHYEADFDLAAGDGHGAYRMGIEWAKLFPTRASFDTLTPDVAVVQHYHDVFAALSARGITPMVTLHHFVSPVWWTDPRLPPQERAMMGFSGASAVDDFRRLGEWAGQEYGGEVDLWITINEPLVVVLAGYLQGIFPPGLVYDPSDDLLARAVLGQVRSHAAAYDGLHAMDTIDADGDGAPALVSIAKHQRVFFGTAPCSQTDADAAEAVRYLSNDLFLNAIVLGDVDANADGDLDDLDDVRGDPDLVGRADFIGLNYYGYSMVNGAVPLGPLIPGIPDIADVRTERPKTDLGWGIYPGGLRIVLDEVARYGLPIYLTENGIADQGDVMRSTFVVEHLWVLAQAIADGADVRGYFHWSLIDNFEWVEGYCPRFGLYRVDYGSPLRTRTATAAVDVFRRIIAEGKVPSDLVLANRSYGGPTYCEE